MRWHTAEVESVLLWWTLCFVLFTSVSQQLRIWQSTMRNVEVLETGWLLGMLTPFVILGFFVEMNYVVMKTPLRQCKIWIVL